MSLYYGVDSLSEEFVCGNDFYIGRIGRANERNRRRFDDNLSSRAKDVYAYWMVHGINNWEEAPQKNYASAYEWGRLQARECIGAHDLDTNTVFADIEKGMGWHERTMLNQAVYDAFVSELEDSHVNPGVYSNPSSWKTVLGENYQEYPASVKWIAGWPRKDCSWCPDTFNPSSHGYQFGQLEPMIWQYIGTSEYNSCDNDLNVAKSLPE